MMERWRLLVVCLVLVLVSCQVSGQSGRNGIGNRLNKMKEDHKPKKLTQSKLSQFAAMTDIDHFMSQRLPRLLVPRVSGTTGNTQVREYIVSSLRGLQGWTVEEDRFPDSTPFGIKEFVNVIATLVPAGQKESDLKLVMACHYDSKYFRNQDFVGATDSSVPCAMLLDLAHNLQRSLAQKSYQPYTLQLIFFDGEEAFVSWTPTDSLYGSRHLADKWHGTMHHSVNTNVLEGIGLFVLLDLLGTPDPKFVNHFKANRQSDRMYKHLQNIEARLAQSNQLISYSTRHPYFTNGQYGMVDDDHKPFLHRGVDVVHVIATPFPRVWHTMNDNESNLNNPTISNLNKIFHIFVAEFLHLKVPE